tara:strand:+ start:6743 stop:6988 length:246 start_codon:yes stop_codon:yes gene_type:complete
MNTVLVKKYNNNKLYIPKGSTEPTGYITVKEVVAILKKGKDVKIVDKSSGEDITVQVLTYCLKEIELQYSELVYMIRKSNL